MDDTVSINFQTLVARLRQLDTELQINDDSRESVPRRGEDAGGTSEGTSKREGSTTANSRDDYRGNQSTGFTGGGRYRLPENQAQMLKKQGRCYKCLEYGHRHYDDNAPAACKNAKWPSKEDIAVKLAAFGIEIPEMDASPPPESSGN